MMADLEQDARLDKALEKPKSTASTKKDKKLYCHCRDFGSDKMIACQNNQVLSCHAHITSSIRFLT